MLLVPLWLSEVSPLLVLAALFIYIMKNIRNNNCRDNAIRELDLGLRHYSKRRNN